MTFEEFKVIIRDGVKNGEIRIFADDGTGLSEFDLAIQYTIDRIMREEGKEYILLTEIEEGLKKYCGEKAFGRFYEGKRIDDIAEAMKRMSKTKVAAITRTERKGRNNG